MDKLKRDLYPHLGDAMSSNFESRAAVCVVLRKSPTHLLEILYMRRALIEGDNWAGQVAFPGGKEEEGDADLLATADRECQEEMGFSPLKNGEYWGNLDSVQGRKKNKLLNFSIHPHLFLLTSEVSMKLDPQEVDDCFWISIGELFRKSNFRAVTNQSMILPGISIQQQDVLWGLSYLMSLDLLTRLGVHKEAQDLYFSLNPGSKHYLEHLKKF